MMADVTIRDERSGDRQAVYALTKEAFASVSYASGTEQDIVDALREEGALAVSLVAELDGAVVGHVAFSPLEVSGNGSAGDWFALGPVSVCPGWQRRGIGSGLVEAGLARLKSLDAAGCALVGDPGYYGRFGFRRDERLELAGVPAEYSLVLRFGSWSGSGTGRFHEAFFREYPKER